MLDYKYKTILSIAVPLMISSFIQSIVLITDSAFISRFDTLAFDAVGNGGLIYITFYVALVGLGDGAQILIARRIGENKTENLNSIFTTSIFNHLLLALLLFVFIQLFIPDMLASWSRHQDLCKLQVDFISIRSYGLFISAITIAIQAFFFARGKTWVVLVSAIVTATTNIFFASGLIFGNAIFPRMGLEGAAIANVLAEFSGMLCLLCFLYLSKEKKIYKLLQTFKYNWAATIDLLKVGSPLMLQSLIALATWTIFFTWIEQTGKFELTASQNVRSIYFLAFVPIWGFAATTKTYVSQFIGKEDFASIKIIQRRIQFLTLLFLFIFFHGAIFYPEALIRMVNPAEEYVIASANILFYVSGSIFIYGFGMVYFQTVSGSGNTRFTFYIELISVFIYIVSAYLFIKVWKSDIKWVWTVEYIYFITMAALSIAYLHFFDWKKNRL
ncbi:MAG: MATE family efflux transporter [Bacteroidota bacterium]